MDALRVERIHFEERRLADAAAEMKEAIALVAQLLDFILAAIELRVARMVAVEAAGIDLDRRGTAARTGAFDRLAGGLVDGKEIVAVDLDRREAEAAGSAGDVMAADRVGDP